MLAIGMNRPQELAFNTSVCTRGSTVHKINLACLRCTSRPRIWDGSPSCALG